MIYYILWLKDMKNWYKPYSKTAPEVYKDGFGNMGSLIANFRMSECENRKRWSNLRRLIFQRFTNYIIRNTILEIGLYEKFAVIFYYLWKKIKKLNDNSLVITWKFLIRNLGFRLIFSARLYSIMWTTYYCGSAVLVA